ncbi:MAG: hypothetical protein ABR613_05650 [Actinomycetota bacterium]
MHAAPRLDDEAVRRWLTNLRRPDRLDDALLGQLLYAHGRDALTPGARRGRAAAALLRDKIESLRPRDGAPPAEALPYRVLKTCFVDGAKSYQAAARLGLSERQMSRERSRAIALLTAELRDVPRHAPAAPARPLVARPRLVARLEAAVAEGPRVHVAGAPGNGKTSLVAAWAAATQDGFFWHTNPPHLDGGLVCLLYELGDHLAPIDPTLASYLRAALPAPDAGLAARIALAALQRGPRLLVLDGFDAARAGDGVVAFLDAVAARLPSTKIVTVGRGPAPPAIPCLIVPAFTVAEVAAVLALRGVRDEGVLAPRVHAWTGGNARVGDAAAAWLASATPHSTRALLGAARDAAATARVLARLMRSARGRAAASCYGTRSVSSIS